MRVNIPLFLISLVTIVVAGRYLYLESRLYVHIFPYLVGIFSLFFSTYVYRYVIVDRNRRYLKLAFGRYISPDLVREIAKNPKQVKLGGERRDLTIFFSDIAGFTTISEKLDPETLAQVTNGYLSLMTDVLTAQGGTLDKYIGDAVMGFFGAPISLEDPEKRACETALLQQQKLIEFNEIWSKKGVPPIRVRIGLASGEVIVGNFGSHDRFNYTIIGDRVNLASRLEGINKVYGTTICLSESVYEKVKESYYCRELDTVRVKGKKEGIKIYELVGKQEDVTDRKTYITYEEALKKYYQKDFDEALKILRNNTSDAPSSTLIDRCNDILSGLAVVEDGVFEMQTK